MLNSVCTFVCTVPFGIFRALHTQTEGGTMLSLTIKILISLIALFATTTLLTEGRLPFGVIGAGMIAIGRRELRFAMVRYRPNRTYYRLSVVQA